MDILLWPFFIILFASLFFSELFKKFNMPWVIALLVAGMVIGPQGLDVLQISETTKFFSEIGLIFVMFMAGLETNLFHKSRENYFRKISTVALINGFIPFLIGFGITYAFGYSILAAILVGIIFISSSIAIVIPSLEAASLTRSDVGRTIVAATIVQDVASLLLLSFTLQILDYTGGVPYFILYPLLIVLFYLFRKIIPMVREFFKKQFHKDRDIFEQELRSVLVLLIGTVIIFTFLGLHPIISAFFAGIILADAITHEFLKKQLRSIGYGIFIPVFFVLVGAQTDILVFANPELSTLFLLVSIVLGSTVSKFVSGYIAGRKLDYNKYESSLIGVATMPQLSTTLAAALIGMELDIIDSTLVTTLVVLSIISTFIAPMLINTLANKYITNQLTDRRDRKRESAEVVIPNVNINS